jgi:hypothetical protein
MAVVRRLRLRLARGAVGLDQRMQRYRLRQRRIARGRVDGIHIALQVGQAVRLGDHQGDKRAGAADHGGHHVLEGQAN